MKGKLFFIFSIRFLFSSNLEGKEKCGLGRKKINTYTILSFIVFLSTASLSKVSKCLMDILTTIVII
jgi:hypothetical protein